MIHTTDNFFNKVATEIDQRYFPQVMYYRDDKNCTKVHNDLELFNNGCLTYRQLILRLAKSCQDRNKNLHKIVEKHIVSFGSYKPKFT